MSEPLYKINDQIKKTLAFVDQYASEHDGEIPEWLDSQLNGLVMSKAEKLENVTLFVKDLIKDVLNLDTEINVLSERKNQKNKKIEWLKKYLTKNTDEPFETARCKVGFRKSQYVQIVNEDAIPAEFIKTKVVTSNDVSGIKKALKSGAQFEWAELRERKNIQIK